MGWPPVRAFRKNAMKSCKYVKVAADGAPYLRKVDLQMYNSYQQLLTSLEQLFSCFTISKYLYQIFIYFLFFLFVMVTIILNIRGNLVFNLIFLFTGNYLNEKKIVDQMNGIEYVATFEDKDGDWMMVGDVPWQ